MPRMLVIGGSGLVGTNLVLAARDEWEVYATFCDHRVDFENVEELRVDVRDFQQVSAVVKAVRPEVAVLTSAFMDVDGCEKDPVRANEVNSLGAKHVAMALKGTGLLVYVSTDYVFDGKKEGRYVEIDPTGPVNVYGATKLAGEEEVREHARDFLIVRPAQIWGENRFVKKPTVVQKVVEAARAGRQIDLVSDQKQSPTYAPELAENILALVEAEARGVYHTAGGSALSRYEMGVQVAEAFGLDSEIVRPVTLAASGLPAKRPQNVVLSSAKMAEAVGRSPALFEASLAAFARGAKA
jgi:dTDP-4-dehydrorhamnose reductase